MWGAFYTRTCNKVANSWNDAKFRRNNLFHNYMYFDDRIYEYISGIKLKHLLNTE